MSLRRSCFDGLVLPWTSYFHRSHTHTLTHSHTLTYSHTHTLTHTHTHTHAHILTHSHMLKNVNTVIPSPNISWGYPTTALSATLGSEFCHVIKMGYSK